MMQYLIDNFNTDAVVFMNIVVEGYFFMIAVLFACWLKPYTARHRAAYSAAGVYYVMQLINNHAETSKTVDRLLGLGMMVFSFMVVWLLDKKRNPVQKAFLIVVFRLISWLTIEIFSEIGLIEGELIENSDWYGYSLEATIIEFYLWNFLQYTLAIVLLYLVIRILQKAYICKEKELSRHELVMLVMPVVTLLLVKPIMSQYYRLWMEGMKNGSISGIIPADPFRILFSICSLVIVIILVTVYQKLMEKQEDDFEVRELNKQINDAHRHIGHIEEIYDRMRGIRHDMGNHLTVIDSLAESGKTNELVNYIGELRGCFEELKPSVITGNAVTDIVLSEVKERCEKEGIDFETGFIYPEKFDVNPFDMSIILTNALQNAVEASKSSEKPQILIMSVIKEHFLIINIRNSIAQKVETAEDGIPYSTKMGDGHGYGLKNIRRIAQKYKGDLEIRQEKHDGELFFVLNIMLIG